MPSRLWYYLCCVLPTGKPKKIVLLIGLPVFANWYLSLWDDCLAHDSCIDGLTMKALSGKVGKLPMWRGRFRFSRSVGGKATLMRFEGMAVSLS